MLTMLAVHVTRYIYIYYIYTIQHHRCQSSLVDFVGINDLTSEIEIQILPNQVAVLPLRLMQYPCICLDKNPKFGVSDLFLGAPFLN